MSMVLSFNEGISEKQFLISAKIGAYFAGAMSVMGEGKNHIEAKKMVEKHMAENPLTFKKENVGAALGVTERMEESYAKKAKSASLSTKIGYALEDFETAFSLAAGAGIGGAICAVAGGRPEIMATAVPAVWLGVDAVSTAIEKASSPEKETAARKEFKEYAEAKQALFVLKKMKQQLTGQNKSSYKGEVRNLYASGLGNPGGMITALNLKNNGGR